MKKLILPLLLLLSSTGLAQSLGRYNNWCEEGGQVVVLQGLNSVTNVQQSAPLCTVEVFLSGTNTHASLFSDNSGSPTPLSNPFTASSTGQFGFYATPGVFYDVVTSNGSPTLPNTVTYPYVIVSTPGTGTGTVTGFSSGNLSPLFTVNVANPSSTPAVTYSLSNANAHQWFGNNTGSTAAPGYETIGTADLPFTYSGNTTKLMTGGTISGTGAILCTDASGNATTTGCSGAGGITGSGTTNTIAMFTGSTAIGNGPIAYNGSTTTTISDASTGTIVFTPTSGSSGSNQFSGITFNASGQEYTLITNPVLKGGFGQHGGGIEIQASNGGTTNIGGELKFFAGNGAAGSGQQSGASLNLQGGASNLADHGGAATLQAGSGNGGGNLNLYAGSASGTGGGDLFIAAGSGTSSGTIHLGGQTGSGSQTDMHLALTAGTQNRAITVNLPSSLSNWTLTLPTNAGSNNQTLITDGSGNTSWSPIDPVTTTNCAASGTGANPSVVACSAAKAGAIYCDIAASTGTCQINTTGVTANSEIFVMPTTTEGTRLGKTCNTAPSGAPAILVASKTAGTGFVINMSTITTNGECYDFLIVN